MTQLLKSGIGRSVTYLLISIGQGMYFVYIASQSLRFLVSSVRCSQIYHIRMYIFRIREVFDQQNIKTLHPDQNQLSAQGHRVVTPATPFGYPHRSVIVTGSLFFFFL